jgi:hypothetical protein
LPCSTSSQGDNSASGVVSRNRLPRRCLTKITHRERYRDSLCICVFVSAKREPFETFAAADTQTKSARSLFATGCAHLRENALFGRVIAPASVCVTSFEAKSGAVWNYRWRNEALSQQRNEIWYTDDCWIFSLF